jgi:hypothetical protein
MQQSYRVRVLDSEKYNQTQNLAEDAKDFCDKVSQLNDIVKSVVEAVDQQVSGEGKKGDGTHNFTAPTRRAPNDLQGSFTYIFGRRCAFPISDSHSPLHPNAPGGQDGEREAARGG